MSYGRFVEVYVKRSRLINDIVFSKTEPLLNDHRRNMSYGRFVEVPVKRYRLINDIVFSKTEPLLNDHR
jgi:hypothetical protein